MTNKAMEILNRRTRIRKALFANECLVDIAARERLGLKYIYSLARGWRIPIVRGRPRCFAPWGLQ